MNFSKNHVPEDDVPFQKINTPNLNDNGQGSKKDSSLSNQTRDKVEAAKSYIESISFSLKSIIPTIAC
jgi:hypothetical protein